MAQAIWKGKVIAESDETRTVEGSLYFPPDSVNREYVEESSHTTTCPWKGKANYVHVVVDGDRNENAAWFYPAPKDAAAEIKDHLAFWSGVEVSA